uniref:Peptidase S1 domain-containing protein n=1 Tax=Anopheles dirus TaxID=7168 RepID=A0A182NCA9_9DIPT
MYHRNLAHLNPYELHKHLINEYMLTKPGATKLLQRDTTRDKTDQDVVRENHRFLWDGETIDSWEKQLAKKYYDKLFKEYCIADLSRYKENKVAMRWRIDKEVIVGKGQFVCGARSCEEQNALRSWEVNFGYLEHGDKKNALVKLRLCPRCSDKLNYHSKKREIKRLKKRDRKSKASSSKMIVNDVETNIGALPTIEACAIVSRNVDQKHDELSNTCPGGYCVSKTLCVNNSYMDDPQTLQDNLIVTLRIDDTDECEDYLLEIIMPHPTELTCGRANLNGLAFELVHNDTVAQYGEYPWVVYVVTTENQISTENSRTNRPPDFVCGGSLIHPRFVLTTAHNTDGKINLIARFGEWDRGTTNEPFKHQEISVKEILQHPEYVPNPISNDIALLLLANEVRYTKHIQPICLPQPTDDFVGWRCISNGWGTVGGVYATIMKKVSLPVLSRSDCIRMLRYAGFGPFFKLREDFICAGGEVNVNLCKGDGGSPLACETGNGSFVLAGIVSWGIACGGFNNPFVHVEVAKHLSWINEHMRNTMCSSGYCVAKNSCVNNTYVEIHPKMLQDKVKLSIDSKDECDDYLLNTDMQLLQETTCGQANIGGIVFDFEHNDTIAQYGEYPWVVYVVTAKKQSSTDTKSFVCGGSLIHPQIVVTTAHNTEGKSNLIARFGEWDSGTANEPYPHQEISVNQIVKHPKYVRNPIANDIALLLLEEKVQYTKHIQPICLPQPTDDFVGWRCISNGWGTVQGVYATIMKKVSLPILSRNSCTRMLRYAGLGPRYQLAQGFMCAGGEHNIDTCKGDGGSPLACETESGSYVLAGIVSWGIGCGGVNFPG